jgi:2-polyprenyl-3-methyl-5-hydroxy-6-metoxy-1,4-benzoquinol methylase
MAPTSITHVHLLSCLRSEGKGKVLDAGCGNGQLMAYLHAHGYEVHGFDVVDHGVQRQGFLDEAAALLNSKAPGVDWATRLHAISVDDPWPFEAESFDYVVANQVLEHSTTTADSLPRTSES